MSDLKLEPQPADGGGDTNTKTLDAAMLVERPPRAPHRVHQAQRALPTLPSYSLPSSPNRMPALWSCRPVRAAHLGEPRCSTPFLHRVISRAPAPTASRCFRPVQPLLPTSPFAGPSGLRPAQVRPIHSASSPVSQPRPSLQPSCPAENSNPVNERKYQGLCPACAATTAAPLCTASHLLLRRAVPIDRGRTAACTRRRRRR